jgi:hypothetical protein
MAFQAARQLGLIVSKQAWKSTGCNFNFHGRHEPVRATVAIGNLDEPFGATRHE